MEIIFFALTMILGVGLILVGNLVKVGWCSLIGGLILMWVAMIGLIQGDVLTYTRPLEVNGSMVNHTMTMFSGENYRFYDILWIGIAFVGVLGVVGELSPRRKEEAGGEFNKLKRSGFR